MLYLIGQIVFCLLLAAILGFIIGWYLRGRSFGKVKMESENNLPPKSLSTEPAKTEVKTVPKKAAAKAGDRKKRSAKATIKKDDLKKIHGIGPVLEKRLNRLGIERFDQIARFTDQDIIKVSSKIGAFPDRIERDDWVSQAKKLQKK
jgi:predicted flap endonuclease-1-like 5' DNA nuclease